MTSSITSGSFTEAAPTAATFDHERVVVETGRRSGLTIIAAVHSTALGSAIGGCRVWNYSNWSDALADALRLSRGMTSKNALAGLHAGGGKSVIHLPLGATLAGQQRRDAFLDLGDIVESLGGTYRTAEDVGTTSTDMAVVSEQTTHVIGLPTEVGGLGDPAAYTARGVYSALSETVRRITGTTDVRELRITIVGLGQVGTHLASQLAAEGAHLTLSDINLAKQDLARSLGADWVSPATAHQIPADVFVPAGVGGMLSPTVINELAASAVVGPANNQLADPDGAEQLTKRGILYAPDYLVNAGGVIFLGAEDDTESNRLARIDAIGRTLATVFDEAHSSSITTVAAADRLVAMRLNR
ncbi:Glu/Leu/Phe/Val dehydrogenase family protein [Rathayibacter sp. VKM Ac-2760]|uniref:Glu/Leu/Phe/Val dehydrogenase family protein n=1 Tax=Rathayibacter sp. VKM Ac-2760 TaxID=2609253 RepID=UPI0013163BEE|nr:Glu/Leu/Phe/Val dehydrogenase family protein [Rathayibacter sp. VKM Ac-2760]QHC61208.1 Glu/Leu/Phe/Val dehydrogenase family protein [Rathayibacter sp. VKM Ac-2760]